MASKNPTLDLLQGKSAPAALGVTPPPTAAAAAPLRPTDVLYRSRRNVEHMGELAVVGEVWGFKVIKGGHWTFDLKDPQSSLPCILFFNDTKRVKFELKHGMQVVVTGTPSVTAWASVQLKTVRVEPVGEGAADLAFRQLKEKLAAEGLFAPERKRPLPMLPRCVGVVTSSTGAAIHDVLKVLFSRMPKLRVVVSPTKVQGDEAPADIADAIRRLDRAGICDVILVVRGGGSLEDLWAFNTEPVARAIASAKAPIVAGVGHESDVTIADLVADRRAATPSNAAEITVPRADELHGRLAGEARRLAQLLRGVVSSARVRLDQKRKRLVDPRHLVARRRGVVTALDQRLERALRRRREIDQARLQRLAERLAKVSPARMVAERRARTAALAARLDPAIHARRARFGRLFDVVVARLESISPLTVLARGYAIARRRDDGVVVRTPLDAPPRTRLLIRVHGGDLTATIDDDDS